MWSAGTFGIASVLLQTVEMLTRMLSQRQMGSAIRMTRSRTDKGRHEMSEPPDLDTFLSYMFASSRCTWFRYLFVKHVRVMHSCTRAPVAREECVLARYARLFITIKSVRMKSIHKYATYCCLIFKEASWSDLKEEEEEAEADELFDEETDCAICPHK